MFNFPVPLANIKNKEVLLGAVAHNFIVLGTQTLCTLVKTEVGKFISAPMLSASLAADSRQLQLTSKNKPSCFQFSLQAFSRSVEIPFVGVL